MEKVYIIYGDKVWGIYNKKCLVINKFKAIPFQPPPDTTAPDTTPQVYI